jgi:hypothetical protein
MELTTVYTITSPAICCVISGCYVRDPLSALEPGKHHRNPTRGKIELAHAMAEECRSGRGIPPAVVSPSFFMDLATSESEDRQYACAVLERSKELSGKDRFSLLEVARSMKPAVTFLKRSISPSCGEDGIV